MNTVLGPRWGWGPCLIYSANFQQGGRLYLLDLPSERLHEVAVRVPGDGARTAPRVIDAAPALRPTDYDQHPATGGFTSQLLLERLRRQPVAGFLNRQQAVEPLLGQVPALAVLTTSFTNSDGDQFPYFFRQYGLGKVIGSRTEGYAAFRRGGPC